jgi:HSP20 family molecular chaperone IbpA
MKGALFVNIPLITTEARCGARDPTRRFTTLILAIQEVRSMRATRNDMTVFDLFDRIAENALGPSFHRIPWEAPRQVRELQSGGFPPTNISTEKDSGSYVIDIALAGVPKEKIQLTTEGQVIHLKIDLAEKRDDSGEAVPNDNVFFIQKGIAGFTLVENTWTVPNKYDMLKAETYYKDGMLTIKVPLKEEAKKLSEKRTLQITAE